MSQSPVVVLYYQSVLGVTHRDLRLVRVQLLGHGNPFREALHTLLRQFGSLYQEM